jgi:hypothetical protein
MSARIIEATKTLADLSARTLAAGQAHVDSHASGKIINLAEEQSQRVVHAAQADLAQRSIERWLELLYDVEGDTWWNVRHDGLVKKAPPWSRSRHGSYGLSEPQARLLRRYVYELIVQLPERRQLYFYAESHQRWALNRKFFPRLELALEWQRSVGLIRPRTWHHYSVQYPGGRL